MGIALANEAISMGADVELVLSVSVEAFQGKLTPVETAEDFYNEVKERFSTVDILIMAAAIADYKVEAPANQKLKKEPNQETMTLSLVKTPDILKEMGKQKKQGQTIIGFAAETNDLIDNAKKKLQAKNADIIVANDVSRKDIGFDVDENQVTLLFKNGKASKIDKMSKKALAKVILKEIANL
jgi:phosphopantothenoylcysteine decarboxylase/phosphopantothenate--cysteine ligase